MNDMSRRNFLQTLTVAGAAAAFAPVLAHADTAAPTDPAPPAPVYWAKIGMIKDFPIDTVTDSAYPAEFGGDKLTVKRSAKDILVLNPKCTHRGCLVRWDADDKFYECPCHHGKFTDTGANISGPPKTPLVKIDSRIDKEGVVWVASSKPAAPPRPA